MALVDIRDAAFSYGDKEVFSGLSFKLEAGEICCIIGSNGCGKTTLLDCLLGIHSIQSGKIQVAGKNISCYRYHELARQIAYVPQIHEKTFPYKVLQAVVMGRTAYTNFFSSPGKEDEEIAMNCLEMVGIGHLADQPYTQISGGEMQLVMLARALAQDTEIIFMDEPTAHLDFKNELLFLETVAELVRTKGVSVLMATHMPNHSFYFENKGLDISVAMMSNGRIETKGRPCDVLTEESLRRIYQIDARLMTHTFEDGSKLKQIVPLSTKL